jgi:hypothetical protein
MNIAAAALAHRLIESLHDGPAEDPTEVELAWEREVQRRVEEYRRREVQTVSSADELGLGHRLTGGAVTGCGLARRTSSTIRGAVCSGALCMAKARWSILICRQSMYAGLVAGGVSAARIRCERLGSLRWMRPDNRLQERGAGLFPGEPKSLARRPGTRDSCVGRPLTSRSAYADQIPRPRF